MKRYLGLFIATIGVFMAIYFRFTMTYIQRALSLRVASLEYDHVAIEDYSVSGRIKRSFYDRVVRWRPSSDDEDRPPIEKLSEYLKTEIERHLKDKGHVNPKVANIEYSFNNTPMVLFLKKRHQLLKKGKFKDAEKIEEKMTKFKNDHFDELNVPNNFWCTFMDAESKRKVLASPKFTCDNGHSLTVKQAKNPSDSIWENRGQLKKYTICRILTLLVVVLIVTTASQFMFNAEIEIQQYINYRVRPPGVDCHTLINNQIEDTYLE